VQIHSVVELQDRTLVNGSVNLQKYIQRAFKISLVLFDHSVFIFFLNHVLDHEKDEIIEQIRVLVRLLVDTRFVDKFNIKCQIKNKVSDHLNICLFVESGPLATLILS